MKRLAIVGLGLMGASLGLAIRRAGLAATRVGYARRQETRRDALAFGMVDEVCDSPAAAVRGADMVVYCTPILSIPGLVEESREALADGCVVTDVGSTKAELVARLGETLAGTAASFVGSHPIAGSEAVGLGAARDDLYSGAVVFVTPAPDTRAAAVVEVKELWESIGALVRVIDPETHDRVIARTSHVPHLAASALAYLVGGEGREQAVDFCGTGFGDTTRLADGSPAVWHDIVKSNPGPIAAELEHYVEVLQQMIGLVNARKFSELEEFLAESRARRRSLRRGKELVVAVDGPSASGKSTISRKAAAILGCLYVDSGAFYRGIAWKVLEEGLDIRATDDIVDLVQRIELKLHVAGGAVTFTIDGVDPGEALRSEPVRENVSAVATIPEVREWITTKLRSVRRYGALIMEGRDIGSVVFPRADYKFYLNADPEERARRRLHDARERHQSGDVEEVRASLQHRDEIDSSRRTAPLVVPDGAQVIDSTGLSVDDCVALVVRRVTGAP